MLLQLDNGKTSQIDHIVINSEGVFVIETKNYAGRIYGNDNQLEWTQVLVYGKVKNKLKYNSMYLRGSMNRWGFDNKIIMNKHVATNEDVIWECELFLGSGNHEFKFDVRNDWSTSYGSFPNTSSVNSVGNEIGSS